MSANHAFSAFSFISFILVSIPFPWHLEAWNTATCLYMFWVSISNLALFINSVIWDGNLVDWAPVWCDISGRIVLASSYAFPATCLCIQRRLYRVISNPIINFTKAEKRRMVFVDMIIGLGMPVINIILAYITQIQRYDILEDFGCRIPVLPTVLALVLNPVWKSSVSLLGGVYGCLNIYHLWIQRRTIRSTLTFSTKSLSFSRFLRLLILSGMDPLLTIGYNVWLLTAWFPLYPWMSWTAVHADFSHVYKFPISVWRTDYNALIITELSRWSSVINAITFFLLFGMTDEARRHYKLASQFVVKKLGYQTGQSGSSKSILVLKHVDIRSASSAPSHDIPLATFPKNQHPISDKSNPPESIGRESRSSVTSLKFFDMDSKHGFLSDSPPLDSNNSLSTTPQFCIPRIPPPTMSLESGVNEK